MKKTLLVLIFFALITSVSATSIPSQNVTIDLEDSEVNVTMEVIEETSSVFYYTSSYPVKGEIDARIDGEKISCEKENLPPGSYITCDVDKNNFTAELSYDIEGLVSERSGIKIFRYTQSIQRPTDKYRIQVYLPRGAGLLEDKNVSLPVISPETGVSDTDGQRIYVKWLSRPDLGQISFQALYRPVSVDGDEEETFPVWIVLPLILLLIGAGALALLRARSDIEEAYEDLSEDEKEILDMIRDDDNSMLQKDIVNSSEYSKAKISSVVSELEDKGVVKKKKEGRSNKVTISRKYTL